jgi:hypothetical protein
MRENKSTVITERETEDGSDTAEDGNIKSDEQPVRASGQ